ncbi:MAG: hypothetical protein ACYCZO_05555 [Daejeonella sp.]
MIKKSTYLLAIPAILFMGSCATSKQTAQQVDQNDDVYYSVAQAREATEVIAQVKPENNSANDYVTDDELYRDGYGNTYSGDYAERIYRFRNYAPWRSYSDNYYSYYDPFYSPYSFYGSPGISFSVGINNGFYNYNPWRYYGNNYGSNFWGPQSYYSSWNRFGLGYGGGYYGGGYYGGGYGVAGNVYTSPNYRPRPVRSSGNLPLDRGAVNGGAAGGVIRNGNGNVIQSDGTRSGRYSGGNPGTQSTSGSRPQQPAPRPERVSQQPQRVSWPERVNTTPSNNNSGGNNNGGSRSSDSGSGGGARPSRGN